MTREEVIEILRKIEEVRGDLPEDGNLVDEALQVAVVELEEKPHWIPWKEGIPDPGVEVLVTDGHSIWIDTMEVWRPSGADEDMYYWDDDNTFIEETAWMPLPDPWEGDGK